MKFTSATVLLFVATALCVDINVMVTLHEAEPDTAFGPTRGGIVKKVNPAWKASTVGCSH